MRWTPNLGHFSLSLSPLIHYYAAVLCGCGWFAGGWEDWGEGNCFLEPQDLRELKPAFSFKHVAKVP